MIAATGYFYPILFDDKVQASRVVAESYSHAGKIYGNSNLISQLVFNTTIPLLRIEQ